MSKFTQGPWYFNTKERCVARGEANGDVRICYMDDDSAEDDANARLIAAAPDLLAALKMILPIAASAYGVLTKDLNEARAVIEAATKSTS